MVNKGYSLEHFVETKIVTVSKQDIKTSILKRTHRISCSGAMRGEKGDVRTLIPWKYPFQFLIECKERKQRSKKYGSVFSIKLTWINKLINEAISEQCKPMLVFAFKGCKTNRVWCLLLLNDYLELFGKNTLIKSNIQTKKKSIVLIHKTLQSHQLILDKYVVVLFDDFLSVIKTNLI